MMKYQTFPPPPELQDCVRFYWTLECEVPPGGNYVQRVMADGCTELIFHYKGRFNEILPDGNAEKSFLSGLHGPSSRFRRFRIDRSFGIFGVYLFPFAIPHLFNVPASEVADSMPDLCLMLGPEGRELEEKMMLAGGTEERYRIISTHLSARLIQNNYPTHPVHHAVRSVILTNGKTNIPKLAAQSSLSKRQFERRFKEFSGFSPKLFTRIIRFQSVFQEFQTEQPSLAGTAYKCGYYDQSHFIHDFKEFSGFSPKEFLVENSSETTLWSDS